MVGMTPEKFAQRKKELLAQEASQPERLMWLSFATETQFLGGVYVVAQGFIHAIDKTYQLGINPGGQVRAHDVPDENAARVRAEWRNRLLSKAEVTKMDKIVFP